MDLQFSSGNKARIDVFLVTHTRITVHSGYSHGTGSLRSTVGYCGVVDSNVNSRHRQPRVPVCVSRP
jgi:hypothetical protein